MVKKILIVSANPKDTEKLRLDEEVREIQAALKRANNRSCFEIVTSWAVRVEDLRRALLDCQPTLVHFSGHGSGSTGLALENNSGQLQLVNTESLSRLFKSFQEQVECVLLNACLSIAQAEAIHQHIDYVIGMNRAIGDRAAIAAVEGMGGVGKTELAIQYSLLHLQSHNYPGGICWLRARESDVGLQIIQFATTDLGKKPPEDLELAEQVRWCWQHWQQGNTLIVFDDVKNYSHIELYLPPQASQFKVLITTRLKLDLASSLFLEVLSETNALLLLAQFIGEERQNQELAQAKELCQRLGYLPLALQLVVRYVKKRKITLAEMLRRLEEKGLGHPSLVVKENDPTWTLNVKRGVAGAFELSWEQLSETAQQLGCLLSLFALAPIPWSLVERTAVDQGKYAEAEPLHQQALTLRRSLLGEEHPYVANSLNNLALIYSKQGRYTEAEPLYQQALTLYRHLLGESHPWFPTSLNNLANLYNNQGRYAEAEPLYQQALKLRRNLLGEEHPHIATSLDNLALLYNNQGRYAEAEPLYQQALKLRRNLLGEEHPDVATSLNSLANLYNNQGRYAEAEPLYQQALALRRNLLGEEHPDVATSLDNLANLYNNQGRYAEAEPLYQQALKIASKSLGISHPNTIAIRESLKSLCDKYA